MTEITVQPQELQLIDTRRTSLVPADMCRHRYIKIKRPHGRRACKDRVSKFGAKRSPRYAGLYTAGGDLREVNKHEIW